MLCTIALSIVVCIDSRPMMFSGARIVLSESFERGLNALLKL